MAEHLDDVARIARTLAEAAAGKECSLGDLAFRCGMLHDFGNYPNCFQRMLDGASTRCPHSIFGAIALRQFNGDRIKLNRTRLLPAVCAVAAHHGGLKDALRYIFGEDTQGLFHLSTRMCAEHRLDVLRKVRERLAAGLPCRIVSTQLVEAGVDLDVPIAFRALGPLDSIQVAGRADRECKLTSDAGEPAGKLIVFVPEDDKFPGGRKGDYGQAAVTTLGVLDEVEDVQTYHLEAIRSYFQRYYREMAGSGGRGEDLSAMRAGDAPMFRSLSDAFEVIESRTVSVFVPYGEGLLLLEKMKSKGTPDRALLRALQRFAAL